MSFESLNLDPRCLKLLKSQHITQPTAVQARAIPVALEGRDVVAIAQTGTGKTLGFGLPALMRLSQLKKGRNRMLVLTPTRELAHQVHEVLRPFAKALNLFSACIYGGVGMDKQTRDLRRGCDIIVATPGRLLDHLNRGNLNFDELNVLVLDEADRMLDMGFLPDIRRIMRGMPQDRQTLMFSATFPKEIERMTIDMQQNPVRIEVGAIATPAETVEQQVFTVNPKGKLDLLSKLLKEHGIKSALVFMRTKHRTDRIAKALHRAGFKAQPIHGGKTQGQRQRAIDGFKKGRVEVLVATDVAARGIDVSGITHVFNFDIPKCSDDYIHRIGRTGRANTSGNAITFVSPEDHQELGSIERAIGKRLQQEDWEGAVSVESRFKSAPKRPNQKSRGKKKPGGRKFSPRRAAAHR